MLERTVANTINELHVALRDYIEATYHISDPQMVLQRRALLDEAGVISQRPYVETTPRYQTGDLLEDLGLPQPASELLSSLCNAKDGKSRIVHNPLYRHQSQSLGQTLTNGKSLIVMTGTGSGKTECFLLPILGKLAIEAARGDSFRSHAAVRAIVLYPMNALVNDQLGRMRLFFGDPRVVGAFKGWAGRPARFARYTSRTLYPGVRTQAKDSSRLAAIGDYFVRFQELSEGPESEERDAAEALVSKLKERGKWPAKPDLLKWYGKKGERWFDKNNRPKRCSTLPEDSEQLTRHEVLDSPPDVLITNYSMLEYMLMRPIERPIFDRTREWLRAFPGEKLLLVLDEAHLYRGAAGSEVALLLRRLRERLGISADRLQVICTSASFQNPDYAPKFGAQLSGKQPQDFVTIRGDLQTREGEESGDTEAAKRLARIDLRGFYEASTAGGRLQKLSEFLSFRKVSDPDVSVALFRALENFGPMAKLVNLTMREATPVQDLAEHIFPGVAKEYADQAVTALMALGSIARTEPGKPGLMPCRVHSFYRGLPGLWACIDKACSQLAESQRNGPAGKLYAQPRDRCDCGARVFELFTCRNCGTAYARAYADKDKLHDPDFLWSEAGGAFRTLTGNFNELAPIDLLLETPLRDVEAADLDMVTGRLNPQNPGEKMRQVFLRNDRMHPGQDPNDDTRSLAPTGEFVPCAVCGETGRFGQSTVQDHQTKGDEPFQALIARQIQVQPPSPQLATKLAPLRGRKVLVFSDSRQTAARLAPNLQKYSMRDALRPLIVAGFQMLQEQAMLRPFLSLDDLYLAVLLAAKVLGVRLRPELKLGESFDADRVVERALQNPDWRQETRLLQLVLNLRPQRAPAALLAAIAHCIDDRYYGLESLALGSLIERDEHQALIKSLPDIPGLAATPEAKLAVARLWIRSWQRPGFWLGGMPPDWWLTEVRPHSGKFREMDRFLADKSAVKLFQTKWLPQLLTCFAEPTEGKYRLKGSTLTLRLDGEWGYCQACRTTQRPFPGKPRCINCEQERVAVIDPVNDRVFVARKGYYRAPTLAALGASRQPPVVLIAAEHTAQLNTAQSTEVFSKAEENELLFQDVNLGSVGGVERPAIDVLCSTTTMEVGIDIGSLSGVSLRNMPPARANYQQRAGRAGRRGNAIATVTAFGSADSHDEHFFQNPDQMIRGAVLDPTLTLDNPQIAQRHITAFLLQRYHQTRLPNIAPDEQPQLFAVLGTVAAFRRPDSLLNRADFDSWLRSERVPLRTELESWLPIEIKAADREVLLGDFVEKTLADIDFAIESDDPPAEPSRESPSPSPAEERPAEEGLEVEDERQRAGTTSVNLLDRLLYKGVLPRYAFPTDVATFYVFNPADSTRFRPAFHFTPSQGLSIALTQYAPGKEVWIGGKLWRSGAIYSPVQKDRFTSWANRKLYFECTNCHYAKTVIQSEAEKGERRDCDACGQAGTFGEARYWLRPSGFAHPADQPEGTTPDDQPARSYATRAKLTAPTPVNPNDWNRLNDKLKTHFTREHLLVTNSGPKGEGYTYCVKCGLIEPTALAKSLVLQPHRKPYPDQKEPQCVAGGTTRGLVLGTDFISDVLLVSISVESPIGLLPGMLSTDVALRSVSEALSAAACKLLELDSQELQAEYRPALTANGRIGREAEIYIYDTLPGGAGFAKAVGGLGLKVFERALQILESCPDRCDRSCYRCLRSYKNKFEHDLLDRHLGASLLRYVLNDEPLQINRERLERSTDILFEDLLRQQPLSTQFLRGETITIDGIGDIQAPILMRRDGRTAIIGLHTALTPDQPPNKQLEEVKEFATHTPLFLIDELVVLRNLPRASMDVLRRLGIS